MKRKLVLGLSGLSLIILGVTAYPALPLAAQGVTVAPAFQELIVTDKTVEEKGSFTLTNDNDYTQSFKLSAINIETSNESGGILLSGLTTDFQNRYGLVGWLEFELTEVTLGAGESKEIHFSVLNTSSLSPGGHYGAIIAEPQLSSVAGSPNKVSLNLQTAVLLFAKKIGGERYGVGIKSATIDTGWFNVPAQAALNLDNTGDVHIVPRGVVRVLDSFGTEVGRGAINTESVLVLPTKTRKFTISLHSSSGGLRWPGRYTAEISYRFEGQEQPQIQKITFWVVNLPILFMGLGLLALAAWIARRYGYLAIRVFKLAYRLVRHPKELKPTFTKVMNRYWRNRGKK